MTSHPIEQSPAAMGYLARVNARLRSLFTAAVSGQAMGYETDIHVIRFSRGGEVTAPAEVAPTDQEASQIAAEFALITFPIQNTINSLPNASLPDLIANAKTEDLFIFRNRQGDIEFIQVRVDLENGDKRYVPQTYWSDGSWRAIEPEGGLPFYNIDKIKTGMRVFLHEGAKAARAGERIAEDQSHPFHKLFSTGIHVGWIGGANHVWRSRWRELAPLPGELVVVADNDYAGRSRIGQITRRFRCPCQELFFGGDWPHGWDVADAIPEDFFDENGFFIGVDPEDMLYPATWATHNITPDANRPTWAITDTFASQWMNIEETKLYVNVLNPERALDKEQFNNSMQAYSDVADTANLLRKVSGITCESMTFSPDKKTGAIMLNNRSVFNQYKDHRVRSRRGDCQPFYDLLDFLFPVEWERETVFRWMATLYCKPSTKMKYGVLALSKTQGVGKSTLGEIMALLIGKQHVSYPGDAMIQSDFNGWLINKRLVIVNEIYAGQSWKTYQRLKTFVTDPDIESNIKHKITYTIPNWAHFYACSNSMEALRIEPDDRRWFVPELAEDKMSSYEPIYRWMVNGGIQALAYELQQVTDFIKPGDHAPATASKAKLAAHSMPPEERLALMVCHRLQETQCIEIEQLWMWLRNSVRNLYVSPQRLASLASEGGFYVEQPREGKLYGSEQYVWRSKDARKRYVNGHDPDAAAEIAAEHSTTPADLMRSQAIM